VPDLTYLVTVTTNADPEVVDTVVSRAADGVSENLYEDDRDTLAVAERIAPNYANLTIPRSGVAGLRSLLRSNATLDHLSSEEADALLADLPTAAGDN
jgi:hypothetical protein